MAVVSMKGYEETLEYMNHLEGAMHGTPMLRAMQRAAMLVMRDARVRVQVDTGRLRSSITPEVRTNGREVIGVIGSNVKYAPYVETGTRPHWPPKGALAVWARRHGMSEGAIRYIIGTRGTRPHPYLVPAVEQNADKVVRILADGVDSAIESE